MPFTLPPETLAYWSAAPTIKATDADIAVLEARVGGKAPASYVEFMKTYGDVEFDFEINNAFDYVYATADRTERRTQAISFIKSPEQALRYYDGLQKDPKITLEKHLLPFGMDYGQGEILIEFGRATQRIFYWDFSSHDWESGPTRLGFVADDMYAFINNLKPYQG